MRFLWQWWTQRPGWVVRRWMLTRNVYSPGPLSTTIYRGWWKDAIRGHQIGCRIWVSDSGLIGLAENIYAPMVPWRWYDGELRRTDSVPPWWKETGCVRLSFDSRLYVLWGLQRPVRWLLAAYDW